MKNACLVFVGIVAAAVSHAEPVGKFASVSQASAAFMTNSVAVREAAYRYVAAAAKSKDEKTVRQALPVLRTMAVSLGRAAEYDSACTAGLASGDESMRFTCAMAFLQTPTLSSDFPRPVSEAERIIKEPGALSPARRLELVRAVAEARMQKLSDAAGAAGTLGAALAWPGNDKPTVLQLRIKRLEYLRGARQEDELEREARLVLADPDCPSQSYLMVVYALVDLAVRRKDAKTAGELLLEAVRKVDVVPQGIARRFVDANVDGATFDAAVTALRTRIAEMPLDDAAAFRSALERIQPEVVELLNHTGRCDEALAECRVLVLSSSPRSFQSAVNLTAVSLKRADGNLGRAMAFVNFQKKGLVPKGRNILMAAPQLADSVRVEARKSLPVGRSESWSESLAVSARLIWLDDPLSAVREAMRSFALAPFDNKSLQTCADAVMQPVLTMTRDPETSKGIVDFLMYGPDGRDGVRGTPDDLPSPFDGLAPVLKLGIGE